MERAKNIWSSIRNFNYISTIKDLKVEPVIFFLSIGGFMNGTIVILAMYRVICLQTLGYNDQYFDCTNPQSSLESGHNYSVEYIQRFHEAENRVQKANAMWQMKSQIVYAIPALIGNSIWGAVGDRYGRKMNIMFGMAGQILDCLPYMILFALPMTPLYVQYVVTLFTSFTGFQSIITISFYAYMADTVVDRNQLTIRMSIIQALSVFAGLISPLFIPIMMRSMSHAQSYCVAYCLIVCSFFFALFIFRQVPPKIMRRIMLKKYVEKHARLPDGISPNELSDQMEITAVSEKDTNHQNIAIENGIGKITNPAKPVPKSSCMAELKSILKEFVTLLKEIYATWKKPRPGRARAYFIVVTMVYFFHVTFESGEVIGLYVLKSPFLWNNDQFAYFRAYGFGVRAFIGILGIVILKKFLKMRDTSIVILIMICNVVDMIMTAFAKTSIEIYVAQGIGCSLILLVPCLKSIMAQLVDADEVGKSFVLFDIASTISGLVSGLMYNGIYMATVAYFPGFVFLQKAGLQLICIAAMIWLHIDYKKNKCIKIKM